MRVILSPASLLVSPIEIRTHKTKYVLHDILPIFKFFLHMIPLFLVKEFGGTRWRGEFYGELRHSMPQILICLYLFISLPLVVDLEQGQIVPSSFRVLQPPIFILAVFYDPRW